MADLRAHLERLAQAEPEAFGLSGEVDELGLYATRPLPLTIPDDGVGGHWLCVEPQTYGRARLGITVGASANLREAIEFGYADVWDYGSRDAAIGAMNEWNGVGEPSAWIRHMKTGRRRQRDGTIAIRSSDIDPRQIAELRKQVAEGAGHECDEWKGEHGRCVLCDKAFTPPGNVSKAPASVFGDGGPKAVGLIDPPDDGLPLNRIVLTDFVNRGRAAQAAVDDAIATHGESRAEFERDRMGDTGDTLAERSCGPGVDDNDQQQFLLHAEAARRRPHDRNEAADAEGKKEGGSNG